MKKNLKGYAKLWGGGGGQIRCLMGDVQVTNPVILTKQVWSIKYLFCGQIIVALIHYGLFGCYLVFYE